METSVETLVDQYRERIWRESAEAAIDKLAATRSEALLWLYTASAGWSDAEYFEDFRRRTAAQFAADLAYLGCRHPRVVISAAIEFMHATNELQAQIFRLRLALVFLYERAIEMVDRRGETKWDSSVWDLREAEFEHGVRADDLRAKAEKLERELLLLCASDASPARQESLERRLAKVRSERDRCQHEIEAIEARLYQHLTAPKQAVA